MKTIDEKISELEKQLREAKAKKEHIENPTTIGGRIKKVMNIKNITQKEVAKKIGTVEPNISRYLNDKTKISTETLGKIAKILDVSCDYLILGETDRGNDDDNARNQLLQV